MALNRDIITAFQQTGIVQKMASNLKDVMAEFLNESNDLQVRNLAFIVLLYRLGNAFCISKDDKAILLEWIKAKGTSS